MGWKDPLEKGMATRSSILAWRIPWTVWSMGPQRVGHDWETFTSPILGPYSMLGVKKLYKKPLLDTWWGNGTPLQYSCLENPMDRGAWWAAVHGVARSQTRLSDFTFTFHFHALEKEMAAHSSVLAWRTPGMGEPSGLPSLGSHRVRHDWSDAAAAAAGI